MVPNKIFVAIPTHDGRLCKETTVGLIGLAAECPHPFTVNIRQSSLINMLRNDLTHDFLQSDAEWLLWIDSDQGFVPSDLQKLLQAGKRFIGGYTCHKVLPEPGREPSVPTGLLEDPRGKELVSVGTCGAPFLLTHRSVYELLAAEYAEELAYRTADGGTKIGFWHPMLKNRMSLGEDISFCKRWIDIGGDIWVHSGVRLPHVGQHVFLPGSLEGAIRLDVIADAACRLAAE